jgi:hypothetical protein
MSLCGRDYGYRTKLYEYLKDKDGYISNRSKGIFLEQTPVTGAYNPVPDKFFQQSCLSIYVESNCVRNDLIHITEKTFEPLIKGHFILPFSNPGTIARLRYMGFKFPEFIDYGFDDIQDPDERFAALLAEFERLMGTDLYKQSEVHLPMFYKNQLYVQSHSYDRRILEVFDV